MRATMYTVCGLMFAASALAQAPAAGSGGGGPVNPSVSAPTQPLGATPPGTPSAATTEGRQTRDAIGTAVIGKTETPPSPVPGNTGGADAGVRK